MRADSIAWRVAAAVVLIALIFLNISMALPIMIHAGAIGRTDFSGFYLAGRIAADLKTSQLYDYGAQIAYQQRLFRAPNPAMPYIHPPFEALLFAPLSLLPVLDSLLIWGLLNLLMLAAMSKLLQPYLAKPLARMEMAALWLALAFAPVAIALMQGQDSVLLLLLLTCVFVALKRERDFWGGCFLGLALIKWHLVLPIVVIFCLRREWKALKGFAVASFALAGVSLAMTGVDGVASYLRLLRMMPSSLDRAEAMPTLHGLAASYLPWPRAALPVTAIGALLLLLLVVWAGPREPAERGRRFDLQFALAVTVALLVSYHMFLHDLTVLLLPLLLLASFYVERRRWLLVAGLSCFLLIQVLVYFAAWQSVALLAIPMLAIALLSACESRRLAKEVLSSAAQGDTEFVESTS